MEKVFTVEESKRPKDAQRVPSGPPSNKIPMFIETEKKQIKKVSTVAEYYENLRLLTGTYAYCGSHTVESKLDPSKHVVFFLVDRGGWPVCPQTSAKYR